MNRPYLIRLAKDKLAQWVEYLQRPAQPDPLPFMAADAVWSACKRAVVDLELAQKEPIERAHPSMAGFTQKPRKDADKIMDELGY